MTPMKLLCPALLVFLSALNAFTQTPTIEPGVPQELAKWRAALYPTPRRDYHETARRLG